MSYKIDRIFHYDESILADIIKKPHIFYILCSCFFWIFVIGSTWSQIFNPKVENTLSLYQVHSLSSLLNLIFYFFSLFGLCCIVGAILSIPTIILRSILDFIIAIERKKYKRVINLVLIAQYLPYLFLIATNLTFYQINMSTNFYQDFLYNYKIKKLKNSYKTLAEQNPSGQYVFLLPNYLLEDSDKLTKTKSLLSFHGSFFIETAAKSEIIAQITHNETSNIEEYYALVPTHQIAKKRDYSDTFMVGVDKKYSFELLNLFSDHTFEKRIELTNNALLINHTIAVLKPIQLMIKSNFFGWLNQNWRWDNFGNTSLDILLQYAKNKHSAQKNIVFLSDNNSSQSTLLLGSMDFIKPADQKNVEDQIDTNLYTTISTLLASNIKSIFLLPYRSNTQSRNLSDFFSSEIPNHQLKSYRTIFANNSSFSCKTQLVQNLPNPKDLYQSLLVDKIQFHKNGRVYLNNTYNLYIREFLKNTMVCYDAEKNIYVLESEQDKQKGNNNKSFTNLTNVYKFDDTKNIKILNDKEKSDFFDKYQNEIFNS